MSDLRNLTRIRFQVYKNGLSRMTAWHLPVAHDGRRTLCGKGVPIFRTEQRFESPPEDRCPACSRMAEKGS